MDDKKYVRVIFQLELNVNLKCFLKAILLILHLLDGWTGPCGAKILGASRVMAVERVGDVARGLANGIDDYLILLPIHIIYLQYFADIYRHIFLSYRPGKDPKTGQKSQHIVTCGIHGCRCVGSSWPYHAMRWFAFEAQKLIPTYFWGFGCPRVPKIEHCKSQ